MSSYVKYDDYHNDDNDNDDFNDIAFIVLVIVTSFFKFHLMIIKLPHRLNFDLLVCHPICRNKFIIIKIYYYMIMIIIMIMICLYIKFYHLIIK
jgi:hypothetical protein